jgi:hypothetical protein
MQNFLDVLLPLNREAFFLQALNSTLDALSQIAGSGRVIILDTREYDTRNLLVTNSKNISVISCEGFDYKDAILLGVKDSDADFIALMNDDDICDPERFTKQLSQIIADNAEICICKILKVNVALKPIWNFNLQPRKRYSSSMLLLGPYGANASLLAKRTWFLSKAKNDINGVWDWNFALQNYPGSKISYVAEALYYYRTHKGQISKQENHTELLMSEQPLIIQKFLYDLAGEFFNLDFLEGLLFPRFRKSSSVSFLQTIKLFRCIIRISPEIERTWLMYQISLRFIKHKLIRKR